MERSVFSVFKNVYCSMPGEEEIEEEIPEEIEGEMEEEVKDNRRETRSDSGAESVVEYEDEFEEYESDHRSQGSYRSKTSNESQDRHRKSPERKSNGAPKESSKTERSPKSGQARDVKKYQDDYDTYESDHRSQGSYRSKSSNESRDRPRRGPERKSNGAPKESSKTERQAKSRQARDVKKYRDDYDAYESDHTSRSSDRSRTSDPRERLKRKLEIEKKSNAALKESLEIERQRKSEYKAALKKEKTRSKKLEKALEDEQSKKNTLQVEVNLLRAQLDEFKKSQQLQQLQQLQHDDTAELKTKVSQLKAAHEKDKEEMKKLKLDLETTAAKLEKERKARKKREKEEEKERKGSDATSLEVSALKDRLIQQQSESITKDDEIQALQINILDLQSDIETRDGVISSLQETVNQSAEDVKLERTKNEELQAKYDAMVAKQTEEEAKAEQLIHDNTMLACSNQRLQDELDCTLSEMEIAQERLENEQGVQGDLETQLAKALETIQEQQKEISEKTLNLEKSLSNERKWKSAWKKEKQRIDETGPKKIREHLQYDLETLQMENKHLQKQLDALEKAYEVKQKKSLSSPDEQGDTLAKKNHAIAQLQSEVADLKAKQSAGESRRRELEADLQEEKKRASELQQRVHADGLALTDIQDAFAKQTVTLEEWKSMAVSLQGSQENCKKLHGQQQPEVKEPVRRVNSTKTRFNQQGRGLDESTKALISLQKEFINLVRRHSDMNTDYCELLKTHSALQSKYERLSYQNSQG